MNNRDLKYLQPAQYESWLRKVDDPDWYEHRYRDAKDYAMASAIRDLRENIAFKNSLLTLLKDLRCGMSSECSVEGCTCGDGWNHDDPSTITKIDVLIAKVERRME